MPTLILEWGMRTSSWYAVLPLRRRVSMSAIGSVIVMSGASSPPRFRTQGPGEGSRQRPAAIGGYRVPGRSGTAAGSRLPAALGDARKLAAVCHLAKADAAEAELAQDRVRPAATLAARVATHLELGLGRGLVDEGLLRHCSGLLEREAEESQQSAALVVGLGGRDHRDVHAADTVDAVLVDLVEHRLLREAERVVAGPVELARRQPAEVTDAGQGRREQAVQELPHAVAAQRGVRADRLALAQLE